MCVWLQVSDQLVEINGNSTAGMTHSQAVEQIRRGGHRIHLVLKRGNGYVPDYGKAAGNILILRVAIHDSKREIWEWNMGNLIAFACYMSAMGVFPVFLWDWF